MGAVETFGEPRLVFDWTPDKLDYVRRHYGIDKTAAEIAADLGVSRSAVCAKANRIGLASKLVSPVPPPSRAVKAMVCAPVKPVQVKSVPAKPAKIGWGRHKTQQLFPAQTDAPLRQRLAASDTAPETDPPVTFIDRRETQCGAIRDQSVPILQRLVCGAPKAIDDKWCAWHQLRFTEKTRTPVA